MHILLLEPFYSGSHKQWADGLVRHSSHRIELISMPGRHWKWRMHGAAVHFASAVAEKKIPDLILCTDMMDVAVFRGLLPRAMRHVPIALYFHENQLSYPWSPDDPDPGTGRDRHYAFINFSSALAADKVYFSSAYQRNSFLDALPEFLNAFPDHRLQDRVSEIREKSEVLWLGLELNSIGGTYPIKESNTHPVILWNHRWEYDKDPDTFFRIMFELDEEGLDFGLVVLGESYGKYPAVFDEAKTRLARHILHFGYCEAREDYVKWIRRSDLLPVTSRQDFFGISIAEAIRCGVQALLPTRLSYPEIFDKTALFYGSDEELQESLRTYLNEGVPKDLTAGVHILNYDWSEMIATYDRKMSDLTVSSK